MDDVRQLVARADVTEAEEPSERVLLSEPIVVLLGHYFGTLEIYNQRGDPIGLAAKASAPWFSRAGYVSQYDLYDTQLRGKIRDTTKQRWFGSAPSTFVISGADRCELAAASVKPGQDCVMVRGGNTIATLHQLTAGELSLERPQTQQVTKLGRLSRFVADRGHSENRRSNVVRLTDVPAGCVLHSRATRSTGQRGRIRAGVCTTR